MTITGVHRSASRTTDLGPSRLEAFERSALPLGPDLERAARRYATNLQDAEDLVQETFAKAWVGFDSFDPGSNLRAWMLRIMVNTWISNHRRVERRPLETLTDSFTDAQLAEDSRRISTSPSAEVQALQGLPNEDIRTAMQALPESLRAVIYYADVCQFAYKEIAALENIPLGTVMSRIHRARRQLRDALCGPDREHASLGPCGAAA